MVLEPARSGLFKTTLVHVRRLVTTLSKVGELIVTFFPQIWGS